MHQTLVKNPQHEIHRHQHTEDQERLILQRLLKTLRTARQPRLNIRRQHNAREGAVDRREPLLERNILRQRKAHVFRRELVTMPHAVIDDGIVVARKG